MGAELWFIGRRYLSRLRLGVRIIEGEPRRWLEPPVVRWLRQRQQRPIRPRTLKAAALDARALGPPAQRIAFWLSAFFKRSLCTHA